MKKGKPRSRANGEGTIFKNAYGTWTAQLSTTSGRRSKRFPRQQDARAWLTEQKRDLDTGDYVDPSNTPLGVWWDKWVAVYKERSVGDATRKNYKYSRARLPQTLLDKPLAKIRRVDIQAALNAIADGGKRRRTVELTRTALHMCLGEAVKEKMIKHNPVIGTTLPTDDRKESKPLTQEEEDALLAKLTVHVRTTAAGRPNCYDLSRQATCDAILFILRTGVRRQECIDLEWSDWDGKVMHVRGTKTDDSDRFVPVTDPQVLAMLERRRFLKKKWIFSTYLGTKLQPHYLYRFMTEETGHTVHELRHTFITKAARAGVNPKVLMSITGHKDLETLLGVYTHVSEQDKIDAIAKISTYCNSTATPPGKQAVSRK